MNALARNPSAMSELTDRLEAHSMQLSVIGIVNRRITPFTFSGFLLRYKHWALWCTAGHVLDEIELIRREARGVQARWVDGYAGGVDAEIPLSLVDLPALRVNERGVDFGAVALRQNAVDLIQANPVKSFLRENSWKRPNGWRADGLVVAGAPAYRTKIHQIGSDDEQVYFEVDSQYGLLCASLIDENDERRDPANPFWAVPFAWYGELIDFRQMRQAGELATIKGMSGGPVFGVSREAKGYRYRLVGIQSAWLPNSHIVRATPIEALLAGLDIALQQSEAG
jgi:hypothetical protein